MPDGGSKIWWLRKIHNWGSSHLEEFILCDVDAFSIRNVEIAWIFETTKTLELHLWESSFQMLH
jgi:hypothetical protein